MEYLVSFVSIVVLLALIVGCCVVFTNAVEHLGKYHNLGDGATGCILAAIGTALPETIVPLVAIFGAYVAGESIQVGNDIGIGAILGSPFLLATLAMLVTGIAIIVFARLKKRDLEINIDTKLLHRDLRFFIISYTVAVLSTFIKLQFVKYLIGFGLLAFYLVYVFRTIQKCYNEIGEVEIDELYLFKLFKVTDKAKIILIWMQMILSVLCLIYFSHLFVENIRFLASKFNVAPLIISLLLAPIATELPEMFNSILWVHNSKDTLALSNITGAMVFQSCIPMSIGLFFTTWAFSAEAVVNIVLVYIAVIILYVSIMRSGNKLNAKILVVSGMFYFIYLGYVFIRILV